MKDAIFIDKIVEEDAQTSSPRVHVYMFSLLFLTSKDAQTSRVSADTA